MIFHMPHNIHFQYDIHRMWQKSPIRPSMTTESGATMHEANDPWQSLQASGPGKGLPQDCLIFSMCILYIYGWRIVFGFLLIRFGVFLISFLVPCALYLQPFGTRTCHFTWYWLHVGMFTFHFARYLLYIWHLNLSFCMVFATCWYFKRSCGFL